MGRLQTVGFRADANSLIDHPERPSWVESGRPGWHHVSMKPPSRLATLALLVAPIIASCGGQAADKLYSREGSIDVTSVAQLDDAVSSISRTLSAPVRDAVKDLDGNPQYLLSNENVVIFVRHHFGEACVLAEGCRWDYTLSATDTGLSEGAQKQLVDSAFEAISSVPR